MVSIVGSGTSLRNCSSNLESNPNIMHGFMLVNLRMPRNMDSVLCYGLTISNANSKAISGRAVNMASVGLYQTPAKMR